MAIELKDQYYSIEETAKMLKVAYLTVYRWIQAGKIKAYKFQKQYRIDNAELKAFVKRCNHVPRNRN